MYKYDIYPGNVEVAISDAIRHLHLNEDLKNLLITKHALRSIRHSSIQPSGCSCLSVSEAFIMLSSCGI